MTTDERYQRRRELGEASRARTRLRLLESADALFREQGYVATTVAQIVRGAEVSVQTLYLTWGSKRALLRAAADAAAAHATEPTDPAEPPPAAQWRASVLERLARQAGEPDAPNAPRYLAAFATLFTDLALRSAPYWSIYRQAAAVDAEIAEDWTDTIAARRLTLTEVAAALPGGPPPGLTATAVADTLFALASPDTYELLTTHAGHTPTDYRDWLAHTLARALQDPPSRPPPEPSRS